MASGNEKHENSEFREGVWWHETSWALGVDVAVFVSLVLPMLFSNSFVVSFSAMTCSCHYDVLH